MDAEDRRINCMLAQLDEFQAKFIKERKNLRFSLNAATARIKELERDLAQSQTTNDTLTDMIGKLQSKLEEYMREIDSPSSPFVTNTQEISSSNEVIERQLHSTDSANSQNVNSIRRLSAGEDETINHTNDDTAVDNRDVGIPKENQHQQLETVSESVPNTEIVTGTDGISSYFSNFYIDPQTINSDENLVISTIPPTMRMVLSSYERFDKRYLVFVTEEASSGSKDCHFLSIDDLLALPENADLVQQLKNGQSTSPDGEQNLSLFAVLGQLIARMSPAIEKSVDEDAQQQTQDNQNQIKTEEKPVVNKRSKAPVKKKSRASKRKPTFVWVSEEDTDVDIAGVSSSESDTNKRDRRIKCKVCENEKQELKCFKNRAALDEHLLQAHPFSAFPTYLRCPYGENECTRHYLKKHALNLHIKSCHPDATSSVVLNSTPKLKSWTCTYCGNEFLSSRIFLKHMNESHTGFAETVTLTQSSKLRGHCKITKPESPKKSTRLSNKRKRSSVSVSRRSSLSSLDDDYDPDEASMPSTSSRRGRPRRTKSCKRENSSEPDKKNVLVTSAEIHRENEPTEHEEPPSSQKISSSKCTDRNDAIRQENPPIPSTSTADPTDINEFVLSSVYEISSIIEKQLDAATRPPARMDLPSLNSPAETVYHTLETVKDPERFTLTNYTSTYQSSHYSVPPSLPCLLDDCTGCDFHPKQTIINLTLDDEFVSSCRDEILADLYSIPNDPPMVTGSFSAALSSQFQPDSVPKNTNNGEKHDVENVNTKLTSFVDNHDIANIIIAEDQCDRGMRDIANVIINDDEIRKPVSVETPSDKIDSDHPSLPDDSNKKSSPTEDDQCNQITTEDEVTKVNKKDGTKTNEAIHTENASPLVEDGNKNEPVVNEEKSVEENDRPVETDVIENQNRTVDGLDDNPVYHDLPSIQKDCFKNGETPSTESNSRIGPDQNMISCEENGKEQSADIDNAGIEESTSPIANKISTLNEDSLKTTTNPPPSESETNLDQNRIYDDENHKEQTAEVDNGGRDEFTSPIAIEIFTSSESPIKMSTDSTPSELETNLDQNVISCEQNRKEKSTDVDNTGTEESTSLKTNEISTSNEDSLKMLTDSTPSEPETNLEQNLISCDENQKEQTTEVDNESIDESTSRTVNEISTPSENPLKMSTNSTPSDRNGISDDENQEEETAKVDSASTDEAKSPIANEISTPSENPLKMSTDSTPSDRNRISDDENQEKETAKVDSASTDEANSSISNEISTPSEDPLKISSDSTPSESEINLDRNRISGDEIQEGHITYVDIEAAAESSPSITNEISTPTKDPLEIDEKLSTDFSPPVSENTVDGIGVSGDCLKSNNTVSPTSTLCQNNISIVEDQNKSPQSSNDDQISQNSTIETMSTNSDKNENRTQMTFVPSAVKKTFPKSIFDPDYESNPTTPNRDQIIDFDSSLHLDEPNPPVIDEEESNNCVNTSNTRETALVNKEHDHDFIQSAPVDYTNKKNASDANHDETQPKNRNPPLNGISSPPSSPKSQQSIDNVETPANRTSPSCNSENCNTNLADTSPNISKSNISSTYFGEFGLSSVCEIEANTSDSVLNQPSTPKCHEISPIIRRLLSRPGSVRCTNKIIEGIGIEIEVDSLSSTNSSPRVPVDLNNVSLCSTNDTSTNDTSVSLQPGTESAPSETLSLPFFHQIPEFASIVKRMLNEKNLGHCSNEIVEGIEMEINTSSISRSSTPESFQSATLSNSTVDKESDSIGTPKGIAAEANTSEIDMVPVVESAPPQISHFSNDNQAKADFETGIVLRAESPAYLSSVEKEGDANQCSLVDTTHQPDQSHHSVKFNSQPMENVEGNSSPLITSSNCTDSMQRSDFNEKINIDDFLDSITRNKLLNLTVLVPRLIIDHKRPISAKYHLRRRKQTIPNTTTLNNLTSALRVKSKGKRVYRCNICGEIFLKALLLRKHLDSEHRGNEGTITCSICGFVFQNRAALSTHRKNRHDLFYTNLVECAICNNKVLYDSSQALNAHIHQTHPNPYPYYMRCPHGEGECTWYFDRVEEFREHVEDFHEHEDLSVSRDEIFPGEMPWQCSLCGKIYSCDKYLSDHHIKDHN